MVSEVAAEISKLAVAKLAEVKAEDAAKTVRALKSTAVGAALLAPGASSFLLGVALGAGLGVLCAPRSGRETRGRLREAASQGLRRLTGRSVPR